MEADDKLRELIHWYIWQYNLSGEEAVDMIIMDLRHIKEIKLERWEHWPSRI